MTTIGIIGAGNVGAQVARRALATGHPVVIANTRGPDSLAGLIADLGPGARAATPEEAARAGDIVVVAIPINGYPDLPADALAGKVVVDTGNYYPDWNGSVAELDDESTTTSERLQALLPASRVVKALNNIGAADLTAHAQPAGSADRRADARRYRDS